MEPDAEKLDDEERRAGAGEWLPWLIILGVIIVCSLAVGWVTHAGPTWAERGVIARLNAYTALLVSTNESIKALPDLGNFCAGIRGGRHHRLRGGPGQQGRPARPLPIHRSPMQHKS